MLIFNRYGLVIPLQRYLNDNRDKEEEPCAVWQRYKGEAVFLIEREVA
mgnify:CR=1 FL=1